MLVKVTTTKPTVRCIYFGFTWLMSMLFYGFAGRSLVNKSTIWKTRETECSKSRLLMISYLSPNYFDILHGTDTAVPGAKVPKWLNSVSGFTNKQGWIPYIMMDHCVRFVDKCRGFRSSQEPIPCDTSVLKGIHTSNWIIPYQPHFQCDTEY